ncbi:MAG: class I SAM-dependent RNA methyltransferase [Candidatus Dormibacteria bacterium]
MEPDGPLGRIPLRAGDLIELECQELAHRGLGVARHRGMVIFVFGALPQERLVARVTAVRRRHAFADLERVLEPSSERVEPPCPYFGRCGGCQLQHASYPYQLQSKVAILAAAVARALGQAGPEVEAVAAAEPWRYRWRGEFHRTKAASGLGFVDRGGRRVLGIDDCLIHHRAITDSLPALGAAVAEAGPRARTLQLTVGRGGKELLAAPRPAGAPWSVGAAAARLERGPALTDEATGWEYRGREFRIFPESFVQVNRGTLDRLYEGVVDWLAPEIPGAHVVDAYGGVGMLSLRLGDLAARVTVLESNPLSAQLCRLHAEMHHLGSVEVVCGAVERELPRCAPARAVVLDPPRAGLSPEVRGWLTLAGPATLVYLSCEVSALARDLGTLCRLGPYRLERLRLVDMFPQTYHFESVALLRRD